jgi:hypothetical protein
VTPANIVAAIPPISASVVAALRLFGGLNAGTPLAIASTPVRAVQPEAKARSAKNSSASPVTFSKPGSGVIDIPAVSDTTGESVNRSRTRPVAIITRIPVMNR